MVASDHFKHSYKSIYLPLCIIILLSETYKLPTHKHKVFKINKLNSQVLLKALIIDLKAARSLLSNAQLGQCHPHSHVSNFKKGKSYIKLFPFLS